MRRLVLLRPEPGAGASAERARSLGLQVESLPLFAVRPCAWEAPDPEKFDAVLMTSGNAARYGGPGLERLRPLPVLAVGEATANAAREAGFTVETVGEAGVEALLAAVPKDRRLVHLAGADRHRADSGGHQVATIIVYRSEAIAADGLAERLAGQVAAVHSPRAAARLADLVGGQVRSAIRIAAISTAAAEAAGTGWERVEAAPRPNDNELLALAARLCEDSGG